MSPFLFPPFFFCFDLQNYRNSHCYPIISSFTPFRESNQPFCYFWANGILKFYGSSAKQPSPFEPEPYNGHLCFIAALLVTLIHIIWIISVCSMQFHLLVPREGSAVLQPAWKQKTCDSEIRVDFLQENVYLVQN